MNNDENLDLLDLDDGASMDTLPAATPFAAPRPKKPWLLLGVGVLVIVLATYIIVKTIGGDSSASMDVDLDAPVVMVDENAPGDMVVPSVDVPAMDTPQPVAPQPAAPQPAPAPVPTPDYQTPPPPPPAPNVNATPGVPVRVVEDRKDVSFNPERASEPAKPVAKPAAKPAQKKASTKPAPRTGSWYVQFGSYSTRALAEAAEKKIRASHGNLFGGHQFVILAASPNGNTVYRLRIAFATANDANGFCRNAKSDGLDCYVTK